MWYVPFSVLGDIRSLAERPMIGFETEGINRKSFSATFFFSPEF